MSSGKMVPSQGTLVKYENPTLVTKHEKRILLPKVSNNTTPVLPPVHSPGFPQLPKILGLNELSNAETKELGISSKETEEILNAILPPRLWEEGDNLWRQTVSSVPATRIDVINLQEQLDMRLKQRQARETGICPIRRELYSESFDELIRQVTINCGERGLLLLRIRDELLMTLEAYRSLYESGTAFGLRKALSVEFDKSELEKKVYLVQKEKDNLGTTIEELHVKIEQIERTNAELREMETRKHSDEIDFLKKANLQLKQQLEGILAPAKK